MKSYKIPPFPVDSNNQSLNSHKVPIPVDPSQKSQVVLFFLREIVKDLILYGEIDEEDVEINEFVPEDQALISTYQSPIVIQYIEYLDELIDNQKNSDEMRFFRLTTMVELLGTLGDPQAVDILVYITSRGKLYDVEEEYDFTYAAITVLGMIGGTKAAKCLVATFLIAQFAKEVEIIGEDERALELAKQALQKIGGQSAKTLIQTLLDESFKVRRTIINAIGVIGGLHRDDLTLPQALETTKIRPQTRQAFADFETFGCGL